MADGIDIVAVNAEDRLALASDDTICMITTLIDDEGDETNVVEDAVSAVVRYDINRWYAIVLSDFEPAHG